MPNQEGIIKMLLLTCPYLRGSAEGVRCNALNEYIRSIDGLDMKICMGRHHEACYIYISRLYNQIQPGRHPLPNTP